MEAVPNVPLPIELPSDDGADSDDAPGTGVVEVGVDDWLPLTEVPLLLVETDNGEVWSFDFFFFSLLFFLPGAPRVGKSLAYVSSLITRTSFGGISGWSCDICCCC